MKAESEFQKAWARLRKNKPALAGLCFIFLAIFIAIFGYALVPDNSPDANQQIPEAALRAPGDQITSVRFRLQEPDNKSSVFSIFAKGKPLDHRISPAEPSTIILRSDSITFQRLGSKKTLEKWPIITLLYPVTDSLRKENGQWIFKNAQGETITETESGLAQKIKDEPPVVSRTYWLGTDKYGRCILSRLLLGFRVSLLVGCIAVFISLTIGLIIGAVGGYFGGRTDDIIMLIINTVWSIPTLLLVFAIVLALGRGISIIFLAVGLTMWVDVARVVRGQVMGLRDLPFVEAAKSMGFGHRRIIMKHILPNLLGPVLVVAAGNFATAILVESGLSYLGFGVQPPAPSWGNMLNENYGYAIGGKPFLALAPALAIAMTVLAFNLVGNGLRDALDVKQ